MIRAHQPGSEPIDIPETIPNPVVVPKPTPTPTEPAPKEPVRIPERVPGTHELPGRGTERAIRSRWRGMERRHPRASNSLKRSLPRKNVSSICCPVTSSASRLAAKRIIGMGYANVVWYPDGTDGWAEADLPLWESMPEPQSSD